MLNENLSIEYFDGHSNITQGSRIDEDLILVELLNDISSEVNYLSSKSGTLSGNGSPKTSIDQDVIDADIGTLYSQLDSTPKIIWLRYGENPNEWEIESIRPEPNDSIVYVDQLNLLPEQNGSYDNPFLDIQTACDYSRKYRWLGM